MKCEESDSKCMEGEREREDRYRKRDIKETISIRWWREKMQEMKRWVGKTRKWCKNFRSQKGESKCKNVKDMMERDDARIEKWNEKTRSGYKNLKKDTQK